MRQNNQFFQISSEDGEKLVKTSEKALLQATGIPTLKQLLGEEDWEYEAKEAYSISKLANCLHAKALARFKKLKIFSNSERIFED